MPRKRMIDPSFWIDEELGKWSFMTRLFYIGLWTVSDDEGKFDATPSRLRAQIFPYDKNITPRVIDQMKKTVTGKSKDKPKIIWYTNTGREYGYLRNFRKYQSISYPIPSDYPSPPNYEHIELGQSLTPSVRTKIYERDLFVCQYCGLDLKNKSKLISLDHIIPLTKHGSNKDENLVTCCKSCNSKKSNRTPEEAGMSLGVRVGLTVGQPSLNPTLYQSNQDQSKSNQFSLSQSLNSDFLKNGFKEQDLKTLAKAIEKHIGHPVTSEANRVALKEVVGRTHAAKRVNDPMAYAIKSIQNLAVGK